MPSLVDTLPRCHSTVRGLMWIPSAHPAARRGAISLDELASLDVIHGPRRASPATYDRWLAVAAKASTIGRECRNGGSVNSNRGSIDRRTCSQRS